MKINFYSENNIVRTGNYVFTLCRLIEFEIGPKLTHISAVSFENHERCLKQFTARERNGIWVVKLKAY